ncbi:IS110 family transposase [Microbacteriaceae bacterium VKM Ac-2855]|nr:IS110 family transposase [Microbacteriaceae bacterium VKM Ac-2855]
MTNEVRELARYLLDQRVGLAVIEATSDYWRQFYFLLEDAGINVVLVNARDARNLPGRKTDVSDAAWLAQLGAYGLVRGCLVPSEQIRHIRDLTRTRTAITRERAREVERLEKMLEDTGIKLSAVASNVVGVSGRLMLEALIDGEESPAVLAGFAKTRLRSKIPQLVEALTGRFQDHHRFLARLFLDRIDAHTSDLERVNIRLQELMAPFEHARTLLMSIPGVGKDTAEVIIAETGGDMSVFPTAGHLASWAGCVPGANESAGRQKSTKTRPGNRYLKGALGAAALANTHSNNYLNAKYRRIKSRRGNLKAVVAIEHSILISIWTMLKTDQPYRELGADYFLQRRPEHTLQRALNQLHAIGYDADIRPHETA